MSDYEYDDGPRRRGTNRTRQREPEFVSETTYIERGNGTGIRDLVFRDRERDRDRDRRDSVEDIPREFPPPGSDYRKSRYRDNYGTSRPQSTRGYDEEYYSDYSYAPRSNRDRRRGRDYDDGYYSDYERPRRERRKSIGDSLKEIGEGLGLGGVLGAVAGRSRSRSRDKSKRRDRDYYSDDSREDYYRDRRGRRYSSSSGSGSRGSSKRRSGKKWEQAAKAALVAGAVEAFRSRKEPGAWAGEKGQRVATAALGAAGIDSFVGGKDPDKKGKRHIAESALGGLITNRLANGPRDRSASRGRGRSQSRSRSGSIFSRDRSSSREGRSKSRSRLGKVAGAGAAIAAGKALYDRVRSKSRKRTSRSSSVSSDDSYAPSRNRRYDRPRGQDGPPNGSEAGPEGSVREKGNSSTESLTDMEAKRRKMRGKELITAGLATAATIHAANGVYSSMVASEKRRKLLSEGDITPEEARRRKSKNMLQDAAAVGIACLAVKSAFNEWKEMNHQRRSYNELNKERQKRVRERQRKERELRNNFLMNGSANQNGGYSGGGSGYPNTYADAHPYSPQAGVPPPPIGPPPANARY